MKLIAFAALALALAFCTTAQAKPNKVPGTKVSQSTRVERSYASSSWTSSGGVEHEITTNMTQGYFLSGKQCKNCDSGTNLTLQAAYLRYWKDHIQVGAEGGLRMLSKEASGTGDSKTLFDIIGIAAYNFDRDLKNSMYAKAGLGLYSVLKDDGSDYENKLGLFAGAGKRFTFLNNVSYAPEIRLVKRGDIDLAIQVDILQFSILW